VARSHRVTLLNLLQEQNARRESELRATLVKP
jgi:hypothetical protein